MALKNGRQSSDLRTILIGSVIPPGTIAPFGGGTVPIGWMLCDGSAISRTTYSALFTEIGVAHGQGDGSTTFNLPDFRGQFLRGRVNISTVTGSGTASSNQATFTSHGVNRTGFRLRLSSGTLSGLATATDYFAIVVDANTLAFATTLANAIAGTRIAISGANSAVITQYEDPDASSRTAATVGGNSGNNIGSIQSDDTRAHSHNMTTRASSGSAGAYVISSSSSASSYTDNISINSTGGNETRVKNSIVNYIIKI